MRPFKVFFTGDYLDQAGSVCGQDIGLDTLHATGFIKTDFLLDQAPGGKDASFTDRLYSLEITPEHIAKANGVVVFRPWVKASAFAEGAEKLVVIARAGAGYDKIDLQACTANGVVVFNAPDSLTHATASAALTLLLALAKKLPRQQELVRTGKWNLQPDVYGDDLIGKTLGIIGLGKTGTELARLVAPFQMRILAYSPRADRFAAESVGVELVADLDRLLSEADFVSLHNRLEQQNRGMLGSRELKLLKPTAYLINVARGELIQTDALIEMLQQSRIAGAGLDVYDTEPLPVTSPLLRLENVILTPHWLPSTHRAADAVRETIVRNLIQVAQGLLPDNVLNPHVLGHAEFLSKLALFSKNRVRGICKG
jgi:phosphoglycerate dehydrogenase-like enzyme